MTDLTERRGLETEVYNPAEDSRLLAEAAIERLESHDPGLVLEVGTGSGYVADHLASELGVRVVGSDVNPHACRRTHDRGIPVVRANLLDPFETDVAAAVVFNPPYLPTDPEHERDDWMERALSGGESGLAVIQPFLDDVGRVLRPDGVVLLLVSTLTGVEEVVELAGENGFSAIAVADHSFPFETLTVLELRR